MKIIPRHSQEDLARLADDLHRKAEEIADEYELSFADMPPAHPGPQQEGARE